MKATLGEPGRRPPLRASYRARAKSLPGLVSRVKAVVLFACPETSARRAG